MELVCEYRTSDKPKSPILGLPNSSTRIFGYNLKGQVSGADLVQRLRLLRLVKAENFQSHHLAVQLTLPDIGKTSAAYGVRAKTDDNLH